MSKGSEALCHLKTDYIVLESVNLDYVDIAEEELEKQEKALEIIKRLLNEDCTGDLLYILHKYDKWEDYDYACDYNDENPILKSKEEFELLKEVLL